MIFDKGSLCTAVQCSDLQSAERHIINTGSLCTVLVSSGHAELICEDTPCVLSAGEIGITCTGGEVVTEPSSHVLCLCLDGAAVREAAKGFLQSGTPTVKDGSACPMAAQLMHSVCSCYESGDAHIVNAVFALLCELANADGAKPAMSALVSDAVSEIRKSYAGLYGVEELSAQLGVSKSHLVRTFSAEMGVSPGKYLTSVRISEAQRLLSHREYTLEVVATLCGFSGANYLCKVFKKEVGMSPAAYREKYRSDADAKQRSTAEDILFV